MRPTIRWCRELRKRSLASLELGATQPVTFSRTHSAVRSPIIIVLALGLERTTLGMMEASTTRRPSSPWTEQNWSTTALGSEAGPILQVPEVCWAALIF